MSLGNELDVFDRLFKHHINMRIKASLRWVTAEEIDWANRTMTAHDADELPYYKVLLGIGACSVKPKLKTDCLIAIVEGDEATAFLLYANEADLQVWNGGLNGGLTNTPELKSQLDKLTARVDGIIDAINSPSVIATPGQDGGAGLLALMRVEIAKIIDKENFGDIEDTTITH